MLRTTTVITNKLMPINNCLKHSRKSDRYISTLVQNKSASTNSRAFCPACTRENMQPSLSKISNLPPPRAPHYPAAPAPTARPHQPFHSPLTALKSQLEPTAWHEASTGERKAGKKPFLTPWQSYKTVDFSWEKPAHYWCWDEQQHGPQPCALLHRALQTPGCIWDASNKSFKKSLWAVTSWYKSCLLRAKPAEQTRGFVSCAGFMCATLTESGEVLLWFIHILANKSSLTTKTCMWKKHVLSSAGCCLMKKNEAATKYMAVRTGSLIDFLPWAVPSSCITEKHFKTSAAYPSCEWQPVSSQEAAQSWYRRCPISPRDFLLFPSMHGCILPVPGLHTGTAVGAFQTSGWAPEDS